MTIAGVHTLHELRNLWDAYSFEVQAMNRAIADAWDAWLAADPDGFRAFNSDYAALSAAFGERGAIVDRLLASADDPDTTPAIDPLNLTDGDQFTRLVCLFVSGDPNGNPTTVTPQGFNGLDQRFRAGPAARFAPSYQGIPQPDAPDLDLDAYKLTDTAARVLEKVGGFASSGVVLVLAGILLGAYLVRK